MESTKLGNTINFLIKTHPDISRTLYKLIYLLIKYISFLISFVQFVFTHQSVCIEYKITATCCPKNINYTMKLYHKLTFDISLTFMAANNNNNQVI